MEALIIDGYKLTKKEVVRLPADVSETWVDKGWLIESDTCDDWYFALQVIGTDDLFDLAILPQDFFGTPTKEKSERRQDFYKFFSSKQPKFFLILKDEAND